MKPPGSLKRPLRAIIQSIGAHNVPLSQVQRSSHDYPYLPIRGEHRLDSPKPLLNSKSSVATSNSYLRDDVTSNINSSRPLASSSYGHAPFTTGDGHRFLATDVSYLGQRTRPTRRFFSTTPSEAPLQSLSTNGSHLYPLPSPHRRDGPSEQSPSLQNIKAGDRKTNISVEESYVLNTPVQSSGSENESGVVINEPLLQHEQSSRTTQMYDYAPRARSHLEGAINPVTLRPNYSKSVRGALERKALKQGRRVALHKSRYQSNDLEEWLLINRLLEKSTVRGEAHYKKTSGTLTLPSEVYAAFVGNVGNSLWEIGQRTGCQVQIMPSDAGLKESCFQSMRLHGTPSQNAEALRVLSEYVKLQSMNNVVTDRNLSDYIAPHNYKADVTPEHTPFTSALGILEHDKASHLQGLNDLREDLSDEDLAALSVSLDGITLNKTRSVWSQDRKQYESPGKFPKSPSELSVVSISAYIEALLQSRPGPRSKLRSDDANGKETFLSHSIIVKNALVSLFSDRTLLSMITPPMLDRALRYLVKANGITLAQQIFADLEKANFAFSASNYNSFLSAAVASGDTYNFRHTLQAMLNRGIRPTPEIWVTTHRLASVCFPSRADSIVRAMRRKGVLADRAASVGLIKGSIASELSAHLARGNSLRNFIKLYDTKRAAFYGLKERPWLTVDVLNRLLHVLLLRGLTQEAYEILAKFQKGNKQAKLSSSTLNTFLSASLRNLDPSWAVSILHLFQADVLTTIPADKITMKILFTLAWRQRYFNMARVIWRYACMQGHIDFSMQNKMSRSMTRFSQSTSDVARTTISRNSLWEAWAAKFAVGVSDGLRYASPISQPDDAAAYLEEIGQTAIDEEHFTDSPSASQARELVALSLQASFPPRSQESFTRRSRLRELLKADVDEALSLKPVVKLSDMLEQALKKDLEWKQRHLGLPKGLSGPDDQGRMFEDMMKDAVRVPVQVGNAVMKQTTRAMR